MIIQLDQTMRKDFMCDSSTLGRKLPLSQSLVYMVFFFLSVCHSSLAHLANSVAGIKVNAHIQKIQ